MSQDPGSGEPSRSTHLLPGDTSVKERLRTAIPRLKTRVRYLRRRMRLKSDASLAERLEAISPSYVEAGAQNVTEADVKTVVKKADAIEERFRDHGPLRRLLDDGQLLLGLVRDTWHGRYRSVPWWTLSGAAFVLLYVLNPLDLIPDALPVIGVLDDAAVISAGLVLLEQDLADYRRWLQATADEAPSGPLPES